LTPDVKTTVIAPANNYINPVIPEKSGIQLRYWLPDQETVSQLFCQEKRLLKMAYNKLFLSFRSKTPLENKHFHPFFELRHALQVRHDNWRV